MNLGNNGQCCHIAMAIWIIALVPLGVAESFPNRPTTNEMNEIVELGTECVRGVNERCWATQYQTNPVAYRVAPFTNTTFYLDQNFMGALASKIRSLVPYYVDPDTVYNGTTNIVMLSVTGLWARLEIGDHTNQFTCIPAIGTNAATYGDNPWRIYVANLQERYKVLNALQMTLSDGQSTNAIQQKHMGGSNYANLAAAWPDAYFGGDSPADVFPRSSMDTINTGPWDIFKIRAYLGFIFSGSTNIAVTATILGHVDRVRDGSTNEFLSFESPGNENEYIFLDEFTSPLIQGQNYVDSTYLGDSGAIVPDPGSPPAQWMQSWRVKGKVLYNWQFSYCTNRFWE